MNQTIAFTEYALLLTAITFVLMGAVLGWAFTNYYRRKQLDTTENRVRDLQLRLAAETTDSKQSRAAVKSTAGGTDSDVESTNPASLNAKKDALIKNFIKRQTELKQTLETTQGTVKAEKAKTSMTERQLRAANESLDQWKEKCTLLAQSEMKLKQALAAQLSTNIPVNIANAGTGAKQAAPGKTPVTQARVIEVTTPTENELSQRSRARGQKAPESKGAAKGSKATALPKLTDITGIGPAIEKALMKAGIKTVEQLADLKSPEQKELDKKLGKYSGRIARQKWVPQARRLHAQYAKESGIRAAA